jgi:flagellar protein FliO/FliZ
MGQGVRRSGLPLLAGPSAAIAAGEPAAVPGAGEMLHVLLGLLAVLVAIAVLAWALRRVFRLSSVAGGVIRVVATAPLGGRDRVVLLQVGVVQLLVGVSPGRLQTLHVLDEPVALPRPGEPLAGTFPAQLARWRGRPSGGPGDA